MLYTLLHFFSRVHLNAGYWRMHYLVYLFVVKCWVRAQKSRFPLLRTPNSTKGLFQKAGVGQNIVLYSPPTARNSAFLIFAFPVHSTSSTAPSSPPKKRARFNVYQFSSNIKRCESWIVTRLLFLTKWLVFRPDMNFALERELNIFRFYDIHPSLEREMNG